MLNKKILAVLATVLLSGCASIVTGTQQSMFIETPYVTGAGCKLNDSKNNSWYLPSSSGSLTVAKGDGPMQIICSKDGYETSAMTLDEKIAPAVFGNILIGGGIGIFVDIVTGAAQQYPDKAVVWMKPLQFETFEAQQAWEIQKADYDRKQQKSGLFNFNDEEAPTVNN